MNWKKQAFTHHQNQCVEYHEHSNPGFSFWPHVSSPLPNKKVIYQQAYNCFGFLDIQINFSPNFEYVVFVIIFFIHTYQCAIRKIWTMTSKCFLSDSEITLTTMTEYLSSTFAARSVWICHTSFSWAIKAPFCHSRGCCYEVMNTHKMLSKMWPTA